MFQVFVVCNNFRHMIKWQNFDYHYIRYVPQNRRIGIFLRNATRDIFVVLYRVHMLLFSLKIQSVKLYIHIQYKLKFVIFFVVLYNVVISMVNWINKNTMKILRLPFFHNTMFFVRRKCYHEKWEATQCCFLTCL